MNRDFFEKVSLLGFVVATGGMFGGCSKSEASKSATPPVVATQVRDENTAPSDKSAPSASKADIPLRVASWEQTKEIIAGHKGKVVVLDLWSTFCPPCVEELPNLVKLHQLHGDNVVCLSLNCNYSGGGSPEEERDAILKVLRETKATFQNLISSDADETLYKKVGIASIPVIQVYDRSGKLSKQFDNEKDEYGKDGFTYTKHIMPYVEGLVKEEAK